MKKIKALACLCFAAVLLLTACSHSGGEATGEISEFHFVWPGSSIIFWAEA